MPTITETFTHADQAGDLTADQPWSHSSAWGIVSNQAKIVGNVSDNWTRMDVDAGLSALVTVQATLVTISGGVSSFVSGGIFLQQNGTTNTDFYALLARKDSGTYTYVLRRFDGGTPTTLQSVAQTPTNGDVLKLTWNPSGNVLKGYVNSIEIISQSDSTYTTNNRSGVYGTFDTAGDFLIFDTFSLDFTSPPDTLWAQSLM